MSEIWVGPRERAATVGVEQLGDTELVAIVLGTGSTGLPLTVLAAMLLEEHGAVSGLARAGMGELTQRAGVGVAKGARIAAAVELGRRSAFAASLDATVKLPDRRAVEAWARPRLATLDHEELWLLALDGHHGLRAARRVASGGIHGLHVAAPDPLRIALREAASAFVLVHNHPSGVMPNRAMKTWSSRAPSPRAPPWLVSLWSTTSSSPKTCRLHARTRPLRHDLRDLTERPLGQRPRDL
jgi:DNA repair protein RadC